MIGDVACRPSSTVLRKAAQYVASGRCKGGCEAISRAAYMMDKRHFLGMQCLEQNATRYFKMMREPRCDRAYWFKRDRKQRIIALLMAAAIAESEGD